MFDDDKKNFEEAMRLFRDRFDKARIDHPKDANIISGLTRIALAKMLSKAALSPGVDVDPIDGWLDGFVMGILMQKYHPDMSTRVIYSRNLMQSIVNDSVVEITERTDKEFADSINSMLRMVMNE